MIAGLMTFGSMAYALTKWDAGIVQAAPGPAVGLVRAARDGLLHRLRRGGLRHRRGGGAALLAARLPWVKRLTELKAGSILTGEPLDLDEIAYGVVRFGFIMLTLGLLVGSVWAKSAWGDFWVWDPKENWSLVTWLVYGAYLHLRKVRGWRGERAAWLAIIGFAVVMFTYLGMASSPPPRRARTSTPTSPPRTRHPAGRSSRGAAVAVPDVRGAYRKAGSCATRRRPAWPAVSLSRYWILRTRDPQDSAGPGRRAVHLVERAQDGLPLDLEERGPGDEPAAARLLRLQPCSTNGRSAAPISLPWQRSAAARTTASSSRRFPGHS